MAQPRPAQLPDVLGQPQGLRHRVRLSPGVPPRREIHLPDQVSRDALVLSSGSTRAECKLHHGIWFKV